jgi:hypothetical protein
LKKTTYGTIRADINAEHFSTLDQLVDALHKVAVHQIAVVDNVQVGEAIHVQNSEDKKRKDANNLPLNDLKLNI